MTTVLDDEEEFLAPHCQQGRVPGSANPNNDPIDFSKLESLEAANPTTPGLAPEKLPGRTFLMPPDAHDGTRKRATIMEAVKRYKDGIPQDGPLKFFKVRTKDWEDVVAYNDIVDYIEQDQTWDGTWKFRKILDHQGPIMSSDKERYKGSRYNGQVEWETGEITWEPLTTKDKMGVL